MNANSTPSTIHNAPVTTVGDNSPQAIVNDRTGLVIAIIAMVLAAFGCGVAVTSFVIVPSMIDAKVSAAVAQANEQANSARTFARLANEKSDRVLAQLEARGLVKQENH